MMDHRLQLLANRDDVDIAAGPSLQVKTAWAGD